MPIFDYSCSNCNTKEERMVKKAEDPQFCHKCLSPLKKLLSTPAFILKGSGFTNSGTFAKSKNGPNLDQELLRLPDKELNKELGLPEDCE